ncbi:MAG: ATP synthase F0 subunit B [Candidatus Dojkabacteria bacterium]|nr:ATP synthase F0 subunit B [Candidatus Dojkabacteria bacterium]
MEALGLNLVQIISYTVIFILFYLISKRFLSNIFKIIEERQSTIREGLENAQKAKLLKEEVISEAQKESQKILEQAYLEAKTIINNAKEKEQKIIAEAEKKYEGIILHARDDIEKMREKAKQEGLKEAELIIKYAIQQTFREIQLTEEQHKEFIKKSLDLIK